MDEKNDELYLISGRLIALEEENTLKDEIFEKIKEECQDLARPAKKE